MIVLKTLITQMKRSEHINELLIDLLCKFTVTANFQTS